MSARRELESDAARAAREVLPSNCICRSAPLHWLQALRGRSVLFTAAEARDVLRVSGCSNCSGGVESVATTKSAPRRANDRGPALGIEVRVHGKPTQRPRRCNQTTVAGHQCTRTATWTEVNRRGERELYCTRHANIYAPWRRGGERIDGVTT